MLPRWTPTVNLPRLAFALLFLAACLLFAGAYAGQFHLALGPFSVRNSEGWRLVAFFLLAFASWIACTRSPAMPDRTARRSLLVLYLLAFACLFSPDVGSDGSSYYAQLRSLALDRDLNFYNEIFTQPHLWAESELDSLNHHGYTYVGFPFGPAVFWLPFFWLGHACALALNLWGERVLCDGYSWPYRVSVLGGTALYGLLGAGLLYRLLARLVAPFAALWGTLLATLGTPLLSYLFVEPSFSHALSFMLAAAFLLYWSERFDVAREQLPAGWRPYLALGALLGLLTLARWQNALFAVVPLLDALRVAPAALRARQWNTAARIMLRYGALGLAAFLAFLPQMLVWKIIAGSLFVVPQGEDYVSLAHLMNLWRVLIHPLHGLFTMHPLALLGLAGLWYGRRRAPRLVLYLGALFLLQLYMNGVVHDWWAGGAFGQRRFDSVLPAIGVGLACLLARLPLTAETRPPRWGRIAARTAFGLLLLLLLWNFMLLAQYRIGPLGPMGALDATTLSSPFRELGWKKLADFVAYRPIFRGLWGGIFHGDLRLLLSGAVPVLLLGTAGVAGLRRLRAGRPWPGRLEWGGALALYLLALGGLTDALLGVERRSVLNLRPGQHLGNIQDLAVHRSHRYQGGLAVIELEPGEIRQVDFTRRVVADVVELVACLEEPRGANPVALRLELRTEDGRLLPLDFRHPEDLERLDAERFLARPSQLARSHDLARSWKPSPNAFYLWHSYRATRRLSQPARLVGLQATSLLSEGRVRLEGIAFNRAEAAQPARIPPTRFLPLALAPIANADYKHNPFTPFGHYDPHYGFSEGLLYRRWTPFVMPLSAADGGDWTIFTTCGDGTSDALLPIPAQPLSRIEFLVCGGLIRRREVFDLVEVAAHYVDGGSDTTVLAANREVFDYLHPYAPASRLVVGQERTYQYDGPLYTVELPLSRPGAAVDAVGFRDLRRGRPEGVTFFAITAVRSQPAGAPALLRADGSLCVAGVHAAGDEAPGDPVDLAPALEGEGYYILYADGRVRAVGGAAEHGAPEGIEARRIEATAGGYVVMDASGGLYSFGAAPPLPDLALGPGLAADFLLTPPGDGGYILDAYGAVHCVGRASPLGPGPYFSEPIAAALAWSYERSGLYILDKTGAVSRIGAAPYFGRAFMQEGEEAHSLIVFAEGYVVGASQGRLIPLGNVPEFEPPAAGETRRAVWRLR